jgi:tellurite resistance protein TehA-like permease
MVCIIDVGWALTFPNVGWISSLRVLGDTLQIPGFFVLHTIMAILMCTVWVVLFGLTAVAFWKGKIFLATEADVLRDEKPVADDGVV